MNYVYHMKKKPNAKRQPARRRADVMALRRVTWFSKGLALVLFIFLPFGGFWLGLQYAPVVYVQAPALSPTDGEEEVASEPGAGEDAPMDVDSAWEYSGTMREYADSEAGIRFSYPVEWGVINVGTEYGECPSHHTADDCAMRTYSVQDPSTGQSSVFLVAATTGHGSYPMPRGAFWGDFAHQQGDDWMRACQDATYCEIVESDRDIQWAQHERGAVVDASIHGQELVAGWYFTARADAAYDRFVASAVELGKTMDTAEQLLRSTVVRTLSFE